MTITTHYLNVGTRTVHYRHRGRGAPVVLVHASPRASGSLEPLMQAAPDGVSVFAIDTPGFGHSDALPATAARVDPSIEDFADALADTLTALGIARTCLYGTHTGADIAVVFAVRHPRRVARLVLDGISCFDAAERADLLDRYLPPFEPRIDGTHMTWLWSRLRDQALFFPWHRRTMATRLHRPPPRADALHRAAVDWLVASDLRAAYVASIVADSAAWIARLVVPSWIGARDGDVLQPHLARLGTVPSCARIERYPADAGAWSARVWALLTAEACDVADPIGDALPAARVGDTILGPPGRRVHWRGRPVDTSRPTVWLHDSPGSARALDPRMLERDGVVALDLPGHGESDPPPDGRAITMLDAAEEALTGFGLDAADLAGSGCGAALAAALALRRPNRWRTVATSAPRGPTTAPPFATPRDDGGHLLAAWLAARDAAILGPWWSRDPAVAFDFGDALDPAAIHRAAVGQLLEAVSAADWRAALRS